MIYRLDPTWQIELSDLEAKLQDSKFTECGASQQKSVGWLEPRGDQFGPLVESIASQWILKLQIETKSVPTSVVKRKLEKVIADVQQSTGRKPGKKEQRDIKDDLVLSLLPQAFAKQSQVFIWIDKQNGFLFTDASSQAKSDEVMTLLVNSIPGFSAMLLQTQTAPQSAMAQWLLAQSADELPAAFVVGKECLLKSSTEEKSMVKFTRHNLSTDEVKKHVQEGKMPQQLALNWEGKVDFLLTDTLQLKKIKPEEDNTDKGTDTKQDAFDANIVLNTGVLGPMVIDLIEALGGEMPS